MISSIPGHHILPWDTTSHTFRSHYQSHQVKSRRERLLGRKAVEKLRHNLAEVASKFRVHPKQQTRLRNNKLASELPRHLVLNLEPKLSPGASPPRVECFSTQIPQTWTGTKDDTELTQSFTFDVSIPSYPKTDTIITNPTALEMNPNNRKVHQTRDTGNRPDSLDSDEDYLTRRKREAVDRLMAILEEELDNIPIFRSRSLGGGQDEGKGPRAVGGGGGGGTNNNNSTNKTHPGTATPGLGDKGDAGNTSRKTTTTRASRSAAGKKRGLLNEGGGSGGGDGSESGDDHEDGNTRGNKRSKVAAPRTDELRIACPFFKRDPDKHKHSSCTGPGFPTIARLKEHIYRKHTHRHEFRCLRCFNLFRTEDLLEAHSRAEKACEKASDKEAEERKSKGGVITAAQVTKLRKKDSTKKTVLERWRDVYRIVFPDDAEEEIPVSPYYQYTQDYDVHEYLKEELICRVRSKVELRFDRCEEGIRREFVGIVRNEFSDLITQMWQSMPPPPPPTITAVRQQATPPREVGQEDEDEDEGKQNAGKKEPPLSPSYLSSSTETLSAGVHADEGTGAGVLVVPDELNLTPTDLLPGVGAVGVGDEWGPGLDCENFPPADYTEGTGGFLTGFDRVDFSGGLSMGFGDEFWTSI